MAAPAVKTKKPLPGLPKGPLSVAEQLEAVRRAQMQADQRVKVGTQLFNAIETHTARQQELLSDLRKEQDQLRQEIQHDVAKSLQQYDQWVGRIDESFTKAIQSLEGKMANLQTQWTGAQDRIEQMMKRAEAMLDQSRCLLETASKPSTQRPTPATARTAPQAQAISISPATASIQSPDASHAKPLEVSNTNKIYQKLLDRLKQE